jgi:AcrR family transcriptional regulator
MIKPQKRDAAATQERILQAALSEFCENGLSGARTASIAARANCNIRMLYHYFGGKKEVYVAALELVYAQLRAQEEQLDLLGMDPREGILALVAFTFDYMVAHPEFITMMGIENIQRGKFLSQSNSVPEGALPLVETISKLLIRGQKLRVFRKHVDPVQLYLSILSLSYIHVTNKYTLSITFGQDMDNTDWLKTRRQHICEMVIGYLQA